MNVLNNLLNLEENKYEHGGYFIYKGREKVIITQEDWAHNKLVIKDIKNGMYSIHINYKAKNIKYYYDIADPSNRNGLMIEWNNRKPEVYSSLNNGFKTLNIFNIGSKEIIFISSIYK